MFLISGQQGLTGLLQSPVRGAERAGLPGMLSGIRLNFSSLSHVYHIAMGFFTFLPTHLVHPMSWTYTADHVITLVKLNFFLW